MAAALPEGFVNLHGKMYEEVWHRIKRFRADHPEWSIVTSIVEHGDDNVLMRTTISTDTGATIATGYAHETRQGRINSTSMYENAETSSVGRALYIAGYNDSQTGASADEMRGAKRREGAMNDEPDTDPEEIAKAQRDMDARTLKKDRDSLSGSALRRWDQAKARQDSNGGKA